MVKTRSKASEDSPLSENNDETHLANRDEKLHSTSSKRKSSSLNISQRKRRKTQTSTKTCENSILTFQNIGGLDDHLQLLRREIMLPFLMPTIFEKFDISPSRGIIFHGNPGTGKTLVARAMKNELETFGLRVTFFSVKGSEFLSKWMGEAENRLSSLFEEAYTKRPSIIFFDEFDGLCPKRNENDCQGFVSIVSTLLSLMDGFHSKKSVLVIAATNRLEAIDPAFRRPGRFDLECQFSLPNIRGREDILKIHTKSWMPPIPEPIIQEIARKSEGFSGADLKALCKETVLSAIKRLCQNDDLHSYMTIDVDSIEIMREDFLHALEKISPSSQRVQTSTATLNN